MKRPGPHLIGTAGATDGDLLTYNAATDEVEYAAPGAGAITYAQPGKNATVTRNASGTTAVVAQSFLIAHHKHLRITSFVTDILQADTYTLFIDGHAASPGVACAAASTGNTFTVTSPQDLEPGVHLISLRPTAARTFYYRTVHQLAGGTYDIGWKGWFEIGGQTQVPGRLNFDAEGS